MDAAKYMRQLRTTVERALHFGGEQAATVAAAHIAEMVNENLRGAPSPRHQGGAPSPDVESDGEQHFVVVALTNGVRYAIHRGVDIAALVRESYPVTKDAVDSAVSAYLTDDRR